MSHYDKDAKHHDQQNRTGSSRKTWEDAACSDFHSTTPWEPQKTYRRFQQSLPTLLRNELIEHQLGLCINAILVTISSYLLFPELRETAGGFFVLSYCEDGLYGIGPRDLMLVLGFVALFTTIRVVFLDYLLTPLATRLGVTKPRTQTRFAEQSYMILYYTLYWLWGMGLFIQETPGGSDDIKALLISLWSGFPQLRLSGVFKLYYLSQLAFWLQQIAVLHLEHRRKDHAQMLLHHIVTIVLLAGSYSYRQWRAGNAVLVCMDLVDIILPFAKVLRYLSLRKCCDAAFVVFVAAWVVTRHVIFLAICWSIYEHVQTETMAYGTYSLITGAMISPEGNDEVLANIFQPFSNPSSKAIAFNANVRWLFLGLLLSLQCITVAWFLMIVRAIARMLRGKGAADARSDSEEEEVSEAQ
jgi:acyl-CoA-dependent ceramide synthase